MLSSASNVTLLIAVSRAGGADGIGRFSQMYAAYTLALVLLRAGLGDSLLSAKAGDNRMDAATVSLWGSFAALVAVPISAAAVLTGRGELLILGLGLLPLLVQDATRYVAFRRGRPGVAAALDGLWLGIVLLGFLVARSTLAEVVVVWVAGATVSAFVGWRWLRVGVLRPKVAWVEFRERTGRFSRDLLVETLIFSGATQVQWWTAAFFLETAAIGEVRASQLIYAPALMILSGMRSVLVPFFANDARSISVRQFQRLFLSIGGAHACVMLLLFIVRGWTEPLLLGDDVFVMQSLSVATLLGGTLSGLVFLPNVLLRSLRLGEDLVRIRLVTVAVSVPAMILLPWLWGSVGMSLALSTQVGPFLILVWKPLLSALRGTAAEPSSRAPARGNDGDQ